VSVCLSVCLDRVEKSQRRRDRLAAPQNERSIEAAGAGQPILQCNTYRHQQLALGVQQRLGVAPGAIQQCQLDQQLGPDVPGVTRRPGQPRSSERTTRLCR